MKKTLIALALLSLAASNAEAHGGGRGWHGSGFWWGLGLGAVLTYPFYYSRAWADPYPYSYNPYYGPGPTVYANPPVYVQSQPVYVQNQPGNAVSTVQPRTVVSQSPSNNGVIELGPVIAQPPANANRVQPQSTNPGQGPADQWFIYPSRGQSQQQAANDRYECNRWATNESGYDPELRSHRNPETGPAAYGRALSACLEGRGYTVR